jgi:hypothetical protein
MVGILLPMATQQLMVPRAAFCDNDLGATHGATIGLPTCLHDISPLNDNSIIYYRMIWPCVKNKTCRNTLISELSNMYMYVIYSDKTPMSK